MELYTVVVFPRPIRLSHIKMENKGSVEDGGEVAG